MGMTHKVYAPNSYLRLSGAFVNLVASWACARQQDFIDDVDHAIAGLDISHDNRRDLACAISDCYAVVACDAQTLRRENGFVII